MSGFMCKISNENKGFLNIIRIIEIIEDLLRRKFKPNYKFRKKFSEKCFSSQKTNFS